jgi:hypothetical protein
VPDITRLPDYKNIYSNAIGFTFNGNEAKVTFGITDAGGKNVEEQIAVYMTPQTLKFLSYMFSKTIDNHEKNTGKTIEIDEAKLRELDAQFTPITLDIPSA